jgi:hypothetical protein
MRRISLVPVIIAGVCLVACSREDQRHDDAAARQAGREAYRASQDVKHGAEKAAKELRNAGKEFRQGWSDAKHGDPHRRNEADRDDTRRHPDR